MEIGIRQLEERNNYDSRPSSCRSGQHRAKPVGGGWACSRRRPTSPCVARSFNCGDARLVCLYKLNCPNMAAPTAASYCGLTTRQPEMGKKSRLSSTIASVALKPTAARRKSS